LRRLLARKPDREATRRYAERFGWGPTTADQLAVFREALRAAGVGEGVSDTSMSSKAQWFWRTLDPE
jgi:hypothetical protein